MGMGYGANFSDVITQKDIIKICGEVATDFFNWFEDKPKNLLDHFATMIYCEVDDLGDFKDEEEFKRIKLMLTCLLVDFGQRTGLDLELAYHYEDDGDRYDDVVGTYWAVWGVWTLTPEAKKLKDNGIDIDRKFFVTFG